jgi:hypothetical protein
MKMNHSFGNRFVGHTFGKNYRVDYRFFIEFFNNILTKSQESIKGIKSNGVQSTGTSANKNPGR